jgi:hypothetical protein
MAILFATTRMLFYLARCIRSQPRHWHGSVFAVSFSLCWRLTLVSSIAAHTKYPIEMRRIWSAVWVTLALIFFGSLTRTVGWQLFGACAQSEGLRVHHRLSD